MNTVKKTLLASCGIAIAMALFIVSDYTEPCRHE